MNDLSVLFPLPATAAELATGLRPTTPGVGGVLLPEAIFDQDGNGISIGYDQLRAVAFRLDPCFAHTGPLTDRADCAAQLRIVFQNVSDRGHAGSADIEAQDSGVHAFYALTNDQFDAAVRDVVAARSASNGDADLGSLAVHPILAREGLSGPFATELAAILPRYAGAGALVKMTTFVGLLELEDAPRANAIEPTDFWTFQGFAIASGGVTPERIPTLDEATTMSISSESGTPLEAAMNPTATTTTNDLSPLLSASSLGRMTSMQKQAAFDAALRVENPGTHSPNTIDCASCHLAQFAVQLVGEPMAGLSAAGNANAFVPDAMIPVADLAPLTALVQDSTINLHAFSYRGTGAMINQRVVNETALNVAFLTAQGL